MTYEKRIRMTGNNVYEPIGARLSTERSFLGGLLMNKDSITNMIRGEDRMNPPQIVLQLGQASGELVSSNPG